MKIVSLYLIFTFSLSISVSLYGMSQQEQFMNAIKTNNLNAVASLIKNIDVNKPINNITPLMQAITKINPQIVQLLIQYGADVNKKDPTGMLPLELAIIMSNFEIVKMLVNAKADVNEKTHEGVPFLYRAAMGGAGDIVQLFIENGAIINQILPKTGFDPSLTLKFIDGFQKKRLISSDVAQQMQKVIQNALSKKTNPANQLLLQASKENNIEKIKQALAQGADINAQDENGYTALIFAVMNTSPQKVQLLLDNGANVNIQDKQEWTPLMYTIASATHSSPRIINILKTLLDHNADFTTIKNSRGETAWDMAQNALPEIQTLLTNARDKQHYASFNQNITNLVNTLDTLQSQLITQ